MKIELVNQIENLVKLYRYSLIEIDSEFMRICEYTETLISRVLSCFGNF